MAGRDDRNDVGEQFDYIVIGAGSAGCAVASRLSEDPNRRVLLLEAGPRDRNPFIHLPIGYYKTVLNPDITFQFATEPDPAVGGRAIWWPRGRVLGGTSSINGLVYVRGQPQDYDTWRQLGNAGWAYDDVLPYFKKAEDRQGGGDDYHGEGGPLGVSDMTYEHEMLPAYIKACNESGIPFNPDYNGASQEGVSSFQLTIKNGLRCSSAKAYLREAEKRPNLEVRTEAPIERIEFEDNRATGVLYRRQGTLHAVRANNEIILSAGAVSSPQILMLSGLGDAEHLSEHGIGVRHDLAGVGLNLQDHYQARTVNRCKKPVTLNDLQKSLWKKAVAGVRWALTRTGPLTVGAGQIAVFAKSRPDLEVPDIQFHVILFSAERPGQPLHDFSGYTVSVCQLRPESRGRISLKDANPTSAPRIEANYLATEEDRRVLVDGLKLSRRINLQPGMNDYFESEFLPGPEVETDEQWLDFARNKGGTIFHPTSTCKMGPLSDPTAVVDERLCVHGLKGLRVADASIMPAMVSGNTNAPTIMIGEKAADMIKQDAQ